MNDDFEQMPYVLSLPRERALSDCAAFSVQDERSKDIIGKELIRLGKRFIEVPQKASGNVMLIRKRHAN